MLTNTVPSMNQTSYAMLSYNPVEHKIAFLNVGPGGDYWVMKQDPETGKWIPLTSGPILLQAEGAEVLYRDIKLKSME